MNNDLISRDALKKACSEMVRGSNNSDFIPCPSWNNAMELIDNAPTVKFSLMPADETKEDAYKRGYERGKIAGILKANTRPKGEWIPVSERLPEINKEVIVTDTETSDTYTSEYIGNGYWECDNGTFNNRIVAWQPLPKPYKKAGDEE